MHGKLTKLQFLVLHITTGFSSLTSYTKHTQASTNQNWVKKNSRKEQKAVFSELIINLHIINVCPSQLTLGKLGLVSPVQYSNMPWHPGISIFTSPSCNKWRNRNWECCSSKHLWSAKLYCHHLQLWLLNFYNGNLTISLKVWQRNTFLPIKYKSNPPIPHVHIHPYTCSTVVHTSVI